MKMIVQPMLIYTPLINLRHDEMQNLTWRPNLNQIIHPDRMELNEDRK